MHAQSVCANMSSRTDRRAAVNRSLLIREFVKFVEFGKSGRIEPLCACLCLFVSVSVVASTCSLTLGSHTSISPVPEFPMFILPIRMPLFAEKQGDGVARVRGARL